MQTLHLKGSRKNSETWRNEVEEHGTNICVQHRKKCNERNRTMLNQLIFRKINKLDSQFSVINDVCQMLTQTQ